jgi:methionine-rich copper-binding protein CopC
MAKKEKIIEEKGASTGGDEPIVETPVKKEEMVQVKREDLNAILNKLETYEKNIDLLMKASDKERLARAQSKDGKTLIPSVKIAKWDDTDNYVIGWKAITNKAEVVNGRYIEDLTTAVFFEEAESIVVPMLEFYRKTIIKDSADVVGKEVKIDEKGNKVEILKVRFENGKELIINSSFVNL